ncbi:hypothetical protein RBSH_04259 [Rhodopirellula baltica SH28]|uniref:Uncharacterized protein n=1 Tax=Rhodopirellula baltica SH28 TaxID=993517 RepID=K5D1X1_RHOBT|nr:hypothetical protein RBSH_04259 [Rhodopirellula baltica SH28]
MLVWETSLPSAEIVSNDQHSHQCGDLCALCNARTMADTPIAASVQREMARCTASHRIESTTLEDSADGWRPYTRGPPSLT